MQNRIHHQLPHRHPRIGFDHSLAQDTFRNRKLPQLWLSAVLGDADEVRPSIEIVRRPNSGGMFDGGSALSMSAQAPTSWPRDTSIRVSRDAGGLRGLALRRQLPRSQWKLCRARSRQDGQVECSWYADSARC
jgi:hypothetical protein